ncbi:membrane protein [Paenibacillus sp. FSL R7-0273]|uniref:hypothetical protein n=1 Tax=Paenibacillus sp. FSL R7-0273 TaxID=1536772 RepID=UPI0004F87E02|nr:hypothetical protein [Paenibacillus sp. FSL R7-0273]AIQ47411.1 membrane protein [Paenibacillus sp. FSL R7-0273]OMF96035.1 hypothetical protein BK144_05515 [Paenibacillus sp. FSL R7-0273]
MTSSRTLKWITGAFEIILAIPILGAAIVMGSWYTVLGLTFILHLVTLILSSKNKEAYYGSVLGIITSLLAWIPFVGWVLHLITGILLMVTASQRSRRVTDPNTYQA